VRGETSTDPRLGSHEWTNKGVRKTSLGVKKFCPLKNRIILKGGGESLRAGRRTLLEK